MEAKGRFRVKVLPEMEPLKIVPDVPVAKVVTPVSVEAMVICPGVVVVIVTLDPATKLAGAYLVPVMSAARICPWTVGAVVVPVPPLVAAKPPVHPKVKVLLAMEPVTLVSLTTKPTRVEPNVEELVPPLATGRIPVTSEVLRLTAPIFSSPPTLLTIPVPRDERVVEPLAATVRKEALLEEATTKIGRVCDEEDA